MLDEGSRIRLQQKDVEDGELTGTVKSCNRRGTSCVLELDSGGTHTVNLNKIQYEVLEKAESDEETASSSEEEEAGAALHVEKGNQAQEAVAAGTPLSNGHAKVGNEGEGSDEDREDKEVREGGDAEGGSQSEEEGLPPLDAFDGDTATSLDAFAQAVSRPEVFLRPNAEIAGLARLAAKALYDYTSSAAQVDGALPELYVDGFDVEQIWGQLDSHTGPALKRARKLLKKLTPDMQLLDPDMESALAELLDEDASEDSDAAEDRLDEGDEELVDLDDDLLSDSDDGLVDRDAERSASHKKASTSKKRTALPGEEEYAAEDELELDVSAEELDEGGESVGEGLKPTEDRFMRLDDMERFVQDAEEAAMKGSDDEEPGTDDDDEDNEGGILANPEDGDSDEEDAELARLLESASNMVGRSGVKPSSKRGRAGDADDDSDDDADGADIMYEEFFGKGGQAGKGKSAQPGRMKADPTVEDDEDELSEEQSEDEDLEDDLVDEADGDLDAADPNVERIRERAGSPPEEDGDAQDLGRGEGGGKLSAHERRLARMADRARQLEEANIGEKDWFMRGEAAAGARPLNSALEIDLDFDQAVRPPPQPTEESTATLEDMIKRRIGERQFDDPETRAPPPDNLQKELAELDDKRPQKGLGEVYEEEYVRAATGSAAEDKDDKVRAEAKLLLKGLFAKLDALSHFHYAPKPVIGEVRVQKDVPALAMEEVAPQIVSEAARQLPEELFRPEKAGVPKSEAELTHEDRRRRRAAKKRAYKKSSQQKETQEKVRTAVQDGVSNVIGRKSAAAETAALAAKKKGKQKRAGEEQASSKIDYTKSAAVFGRLQDAREAAANGAPKPKKSRGDGTVRKSSALKL